MIRVAKERGIVVVFALHNFAYDDASLFRGVDAVVVPSEFTRRWYRERFGLKCVVLPYAIDWQRVLVAGERSDTPHPGPLPQGAREYPQRSTLNARRYVTFVNPQPTKGLFVFARIAEQIARRRPDIPVL